MYIEVYLHFLLALVNIELRHYIDAHISLVYFISYKYIYIYNII